MLKAIAGTTVTAGGVGVGIYGYRHNWFGGEEEQNGTSGGRKPLKLTSGYIPILDCVPLIVAYEMGYFKQFGVSAEKPKLIRGWPALLEAFESRQILLTHILLPQVIFMRYARNVHVRSIAFNHTNVVAMLRAKGVNSVRELGGRVVGCPTWWAPHTGIFQDVLRKAGLKPVAGRDDNDVAADEVLFRVIAPPDMPESLKTGAIAGCTVSEPFGAMSEVLAEATMLKMSGDVWRNHPCCQSVILQETIDRDRPWAEAVTRAIYKGAQWARENTEELAEMLGKDGKGYFPMPIKIVRKALLGHDLETYGPDGSGAIMHTDWDVRRVDFIPYPFRSAFDTTIEMMRRMVVDRSAALPTKLRNLGGRDLADTIVDYDLAMKGMASVGGAPAFGLEDSDLENRDQQFEVLLKNQ